MSIIREVYPQCDYCNEAYPDVTYETNKRCVEDMKIFGWKKIKGSDMCPDCVLKLKEEKK
jgi:hypothetical protein